MYEQAISMFRQMREKKLPVTTVTWNHYLSCLWAKTQDPQKVYQAVEEMVADGIQLSAETYARLIQVSLRSSILNKEKQKIIVKIIFREQNHFLIWPNKKSWQILLCIMK